MRYHKIPDETVRRLPGYLRGLFFLSRAGNKDISSRDLADFLGVHHWQVRKDFSYFGTFGTPGVGYNINKLIKEVRRILKLDVLHRVALVGVGNLGAALLEYGGFGEYAFEIVAAFDNNPKKIGKTVGKVVIEDVSRLKTISKRNIRIAVVAVPSKAVQETADVLVKANVRGILNFASSYLVVPKKVKVISMNIAVELARLPYYIVTP